MATTIYDVAESAGVSVATVSRVFNRRPHVSASVRDGVLKTARRLGYSPQQSATRDCYAIVVETGNQPGLTGYHEMLLRAINRKALSGGHRLELLQLDDLSATPDRFFAGVISTVYNPDGVSAVAKIGKSLDIPRVLINSQVRGTSSVCTDEHAGMAELLGILAEADHKQVLSVGHHTAAWCSKERQTALDALAADRGIHLTHVDVVESNVLDSLTTALDPKITAVLALGEGLGHRVVHYLRKLRVKPGKDVSVVAHEMPGVSEFCDPPLTTIEQDFDGLAESAFGALTFKKPRRLLIPYRTHRRESVHPAKARTTPPKTGRAKRSKE